MSWRRYFRRARRDDELADEIAHYVAEETDNNVARGMSPDAARDAAVRKFGNRAAIRERVYEMNTIALLDLLAQDLRYGFRQLRLRPGFALAAILSLALGIGANTAIFTLVDQLLLRLLPVERPRELVQLRLEGARPGGNWGDGLHTFPYPTYLALRDRTTVFSGLTGQRVEPVNMLDDDGGAAIPVALVAGNYFQVLGVRAHVGRLLSPDDDRTTNGSPVAVLQYDFWQSQYQGRQTIVGETIRLNGKPFTIVGVAAPRFEGTNVGVPTKIFVPVTMQPAILPTLPGIADERSAWFYPFARLKPGVTLEQAQASMKVVYRQRVDEELQQSYFSRFPESRDSLLKQTFSLEPGDRGDSGLRTRFEGPLLILEGLAAVVLLIACANIAGLLLARGAARRRDLAIRRAIGAGRGRIVGQLFAETALVTLAGAGAGLVLGSWLTQLLIALLPAGIGDVSLSSTPDLRVLVFTMAVTVVTSMLCGLLPAWQNSQAAAPVSTLREESGSIAGGRTHVRFRKFFVATQVGLSAVLLLGAGLFIRSLMKLQQVDLGLRPERVATFFAGPAVPYDAAQKRQAFRAIVEGLAALPGVVAVGANRGPMFTGSRSDGVLNIAGRPDTGEAPFTFFNAVTPGYFAALGIPIKAGADFTWRDWGTGKQQALVNQVVADIYFDGAPIGKLVGQGTRSPTTVEIVGVFGNARFHEVRGDVPPQTYFNLDSVVEKNRGIAVYVRTAGDPRLVMPSLRSAVRRIDPNFVVSNMRTLEEQIDSRMANERMLSFLSGGFAVLATLLAIVGLHGVLAFQVANRTREIGIRMALGARRHSVVRLIASDMVVVVLCGLAAGVAAGYFAGRYVQSQLFGVDANDPLVFMMVVVALVSASSAAAILPAVRASRIDPLRALRHD